MPEPTRAAPAGEPASDWVRRWSHLVADGATVLDVACGSGRHVRWFAGRGCRVTGVDRDAGATAPLRSIAEIVTADLEAAAWPLAGRTFDAVVVTRYLWRPLWPTLLASLAPGGILFYETFSLAQRFIGRPSNPDFLLRPGELLETARGLLVIAYEDGFEPEPGRCTQRIVAAREPAARATLPRAPVLGGAPIAGG